MKLALTFLAGCAAAMAAMPSDELVHSKDFVESVQLRAKGWESGYNPRFAGWTFGSARKLMGTNLTRNAEQVAQFPAKRATGMALPDSFDARQQWSSCSILGHIRDQASCGSCWAVSSTDSFNGRLCVATGYDKELSAEVTNSCCNLGGAGLTCLGSQGCNGGQPAEAWSFFVNDGIPTGGDYSDIGTGRSCAPYAIHPCWHHEYVPGLPQCTEGGSTPACPNKKCTESNYTIPYEQDLHNAKSVHSLPSVESIMEDLVQSGPVTVAFSVYSDFLTYKSGIYRHQSGTYEGGHAVQIIGYGTENGEDYWLVKNSWGDYWGDGGLVKFLKGVDECGIESQAVAGVAA